MALEDSIAQLEPEELAAALKEAEIFRNNGVLEDKSLIKRIAGTIAYHPTEFDFAIVCNEVYRQIAIKSRENG